MGLIFVDGCDSYDDAGGINTKWASVATNDINSVSDALTSGPFGGTALSFQASAGVYFVHNFAARVAFARVGCAFWHRKNNTVLDWNDTLINLTFDGSTGTTSGNGYHLVNNPSTGVLDFRSGGTSLGTDSSFAIRPFQWNHIEIWVFPDETVGTAQVWVNGALLIDVSATDTIFWSGAIELTGIGFYHDFTGTFQRYDDIMLWDETDDGLDNDIITSGVGFHRIETRRPAGAGSNTDFTPSSGTNWEAVDELAASSSDYVGAGTSGDRDTYDYEALTTNIEDILGVVHNILPRKETGGFRQLNHLCISSNTTASGLEKTGGVGLTTESTNAFHHQQFFMADPLTTLAWTTSGLDAAEFGFELEKTT